MSSYGERSGRSPDFRVRYRWLPQGQRPFQHIRCDFAYEGDGPEDSIYMIWPEFEDAAGRPLPAGRAVPEQGTATMWILNDELRDQIHRQRIKRGVRGYFVVGTQRIAEVEVTDVLGLAPKRAT